jgi:hypothetical protein
VLRAYLTEEKRCYDHPHRVVKTACARCKVAYCEECLEERTGGLFARIVARDEKQPRPLFCSRCVEEVEALEALEAERKRPLHQRLRPTRSGLHRAAIYVAVILVIAVPLAFGVRSIAEATLSPEEFARIRTGLLGSFTTAEGTNLASSLIGGTFIRASAPSQPNHDPSRLIDTWAAASVAGWRSQDATLPQELVFALPSKTRITKVILRPHPTEPEETWVKDYEILVSADSPNTGFTRVASGTLDVQQARAAMNVENAGEPVRLEFADTVAHYVMLRITSNQGSRDYTSLAELEVYWLRR